MARTIKRQPLSVSTSSSSYPVRQTLIQAEFKGLNTAKNNVLADQMSFASAENVYVNDNMLLVSRPPFKFYDGEGYIEKQWHFGPYRLRLYKQLIDNEFVYTLKCISHNLSVPADATDKYDKYVWHIPIKTTSLEATGIQIEDKIFVWFGGFDLIVFNTSGLYFESGIKYLYLPILSLVVNGIETSVESENFLTLTGRRRHQYSVLSSVNFESLLGKDVRVSLSSPVTENSSKYLYTTTIRDTNPVLIYPSAAISNNYHFDVAQGLNTVVYMRYSEITNIISVSFDGRYFQALPMLTDMVGLPQLTKDGTHVVAFTPAGIAWCKLFADTSTESAMAFSFVWDITSYTDSGRFVRTFKPIGRFDSRKQFAYFAAFHTTDGPNDYYNIEFYAEWPNGDSQASYSFNATDFLDDGNGNDIKLTLCYVAPNKISSSSELLVGILGSYINDESAAITVIRLKPNPNASRTIYTQSLRTDYYLGNQKYTFANFVVNCENYDITIYPNESNGFIVRGVFSAKLKTNSINSYTKDCKITGYYKYDAGTGQYNFSITQHAIISEGSNRFKLSADNDDFITDKYFYRNGNLEIWPEILQTSREITNGDAFNLLFDKYSWFDDYSWFGNVHKIDEDMFTTHYPKLSDAPIKSGDLVMWKPNARTVKDYFTPNVIDNANTDNYLHLFKIERITANGTLLTGAIYPGDYVKLTAYDKSIDISAYAIRNNYENDSETKISTDVWIYPQAPSFWEIGEDWPLSPSWSPMYAPKPFYWKQGDDLPTGPVIFSGQLQPLTQVLPLMLNEYGVTVNINGVLWKSQLDSDSILELDEYINTVEDDTGQTIDTRLHVPTHHNVLDTHYFSFEVNNKHLLEVMQVKRNEDALFIENTTDILLYLPKRNEQIFANKITNLCPIADNILSVFTEESIWNITASILDNGVTVFSAPIASKIPAGCRDGDDVIVALDGQALLLATPRGIAALAPQDFVATADNVMTYLSDSIQDIYYEFYKNKVKSTVKIDGYDSQIKMLSYRYWIIFYRYMDRDILVLDTRNNTWWKWSAPYPIKQIVDDLHLHVIMQIDYSADNSLGGVYYVWKDHEDTIFEGTADDTFKLPQGIKSRKGYRDDIVPNTLNGASYDIYENEFAGSRTIKEYASPTINWHFMSQKLHFNQINNYKAIKEIAGILQGDDTLQTVLSTRIYRSLYHPEQNDVIKVSVNELKTFTHRLNLMHTINFQYKFENDTSQEEPIPLRLESLSIKYEVKEGIR